MCSHLKSVGGDVRKTEGEKSEKKRGRSAILILEQEEEEEEAAKR